MTVIRTAVIVALLALLPVTGAYASAEKGLEAFRAAKYEKALRYLNPAAEKGDANARYLLGRMYAAGLGVKMDKVKAVELYRLAAEDGQAQAQKYLGDALVLGEGGVDTDLVEAYKWLLLAGMSEVRGAKATAKKVGGYLPKDLQFEARRAARNWRKNYEEKSKKKK